MSGASETQIIVEAQTIFDVPANGIYYANLVVIGVPVPSSKGASTELSQGNGPEAPITISSTVEYRFPDASLDHP